MNKIVWHLKQQLKAITEAIDKRHYNLSNVVVVSNNCFGGEIYKRFNLKFNTPFIGLFMYGSDYIKLLSNFDYYLQQPLSFTKHSKYSQRPKDYPIACLEDLEIHFMHYDTEEEVLEKWQRRLERFYRCKETHRVIYKFCDRDGATQEELDRFHALPYGHKISFGIEAYQNLNHIKIKESDNGCVPDGVKLYVLCQRYLDLYDWIKSGRIRKNWYSSLKSYLDIA